MHTQALDTNGIRLEVTTAGPPDGGLVILLHGFPESADAWQRQVPALAGAGLRVLAPSQRGYAGSSKPTALASYRLSVLARDVVGLADAVGATTFSVVGHDWGAAVAWHLATVFPERVKRLVVMNGPHAGTVATATLRHPLQFLRSWYIGAFQVPFAPELLLKANGYGWLRRALETTARPGAFPPDLLERYREQWAQPGALTAMLNWYRALALDPPTPATKLALPATMLWGEQDRFLERGLADAALALCTQGKLVPFAQATHWLHHEEPEAVNRELLKALAA
jgi:pimeloyl-ACP methyl ester carboxylesterase